MTEKLPSVGDTIRYRAKRADGTFRTGESVVNVVWQYDDLPVLTLTDGTRLCLGCGDTFETTSSLTGAWP